MAKSPTDYQPPIAQAKSNPPAARPIRRFRWSLVLVPGVCILAVWVLNHLQPAFRWEDLLDRFHIQGQERIRMSRLVGLGLICIGAVVVKRIWVSN